jgi:hypothetical protein
MDQGRVARSTMDQRWRGPKAPEQSGVLTGAWPPVTPEHGSLSAGAQQRVGNMGNSFRASLGLGQRRGDRAMTRKWRRRESSATVALGLWKRGQ